MIRRNCMRGSLLALLATAVPAVAPPSASAETGTGQHVRLELVRTTTGPASIDFGYIVVTTDGPGFYGWVRARVQNGVVKAVEPGEQTSKGTMDDPGVYAGPNSATTCHTLGQCVGPSTLFGGGGFDVSDDGGATADNVIFIAIDGPAADSVTWEVKASGWQVKRVPFGSSHVDGTDPSAGAVAAGLAYGGAELFTNASAPGSSQGSIAQAMPPCSSTSGVRVGAGQLTLAGGANRPSMICPSASQSGIVDFAPGPTTWDATGAVAGDRSFATTRLWVVDLPTIPDWYRPDSSGE